MKPRYITYNGITKTSPEWAREYGIDPEILNNRIRHGWDIDAALHTPVRRQFAQRYEYQGKMLTAQEISAMHGNLAPTSVRQRLEKGMTVEEVLATPNTRPNRRTEVTERKKVQTVQLVHRPRKPDKTQCKSCIYHGTFGMGGDSVYCDFIEVEGHRRGCPPSPNCKAYIRGKSVVRQMALKRAGKR